MNLILLQPHQFIDEQRVELDQTYAQHILQVLKAGPGDKLVVGQLGGNMGEAEITAVSGERVALRILQLDTPPPAQIPLTLVLALPRPRMLQRSLQNIATLGVERVCLVQTQRVEKSYWQTPLLAPEAVHQQLVLGLEQARATQMPKLSLHKGFRPFCEEVLPEITQNRSCLLAHPGDYPPCPRQPGTATTLAVGPEGGFTAHEVEKLVAAGFQPVQLGQRILRVETAIQVLIAKLFY